MHLGNVMCALIAYLSAKSRGGKFLLRIEDLDAERCPVRYADEIFRDLEALGILWDGEVIWQSRRTEIYREFYEELRRHARVYPCFCSRAALHAAEAPHLSDGSVVYPGTCRNLAVSEAEAAMRKRKPSMRVEVPDLCIEFNDEYCGRCGQDLRGECGDFVVRRADGVFAYQLAVVVDDALSGVTEVVRGEDLLSSAARQIWLHRIFGFDPPAFCHIPLLTDAAGRRLSKRDGDSVGALLKEHSPKEIIGMLAYAAGITEEPAEATPAELVSSFDLGRLRKNRVWKADLSAFSK